MIIFIFDHSSNHSRVEIEFFSRASLEHWEIPLWCNPRITNGTWACIDYVFGYFLLSLFFLCYQQLVTKHYLSKPVIIIIIIDIISDKMTKICPEWCRGWRKLINEQQLHLSFEEKTLIIVPLRYNVVQKINY